MVISKSWITRRYVVILLASSLAAALIGAAISFSNTGAGSRTAVPRQGFALSAGEDTSALEVVDSGSREIQYLEELSTLGSRPSDIALDQAGNLWVIWTTNDGQLVLARRDPIAPALSEFSLEIAGPATNPKLSIEPGGQLVIGVGAQILVLDPRTLEYRRIDLPPPTGTKPGDLSRGLGSIIEMRTTGEAAFVSRFGVDAISVVLLDSGEVQDLDIPRSFGGFDDFLVSASKIWLLKTGDTLDGPPSQLGALDRSTGALDVISLKVRSAGLHKDALVVVTWQPDSLVLVEEDGSIETPAQSLTSYFTNGLGVEGDVLSDSNGHVWINELSNNAIVWFDLISGDSKVFPLPTFRMHGALSCPPGAQCPTEATVLTNVTATALAPNGDLYFADGTKQLIGIIAAP